MTWNHLNRVIATCQLCPRLRAHCTTTAKIKRAAFKDQTYWGKPVPNLAPADPSSVRLLIIGLAPAAHGANRTGRMFTGDRSGDFLYRAMFETGFASQPTATHAQDGLQLIDCAITATCHCAPPDNKPTIDEMAACQPFLDQTLDLLPHFRGVLALGKIAWDAATKLFARQGWELGRPAVKFAHGAVAWSDNRRFLLGSYHPSQQNTFTGRLTPAMMHAIFQQARQLINAPAKSA